MVHGSNAFTNRIVSVEMITDFLSGPMFTLAVGTLIALVLSMVRIRLQIRFAIAGAAGGADPLPAESVQPDYSLDRLLRPMMESRREIPAATWGGKSLTDAVLEDQRRQLEERDEEVHGTEHIRSDPIPGSSVVVSNAQIREMLIDALESNGLGSLVNEEYPNHIAVQIFAKSITVPAANIITSAPIDSTFGFVKISNDKTAVRGTVNIVDPIFPNKTREIPQAYVNSVLYAFLPYFAAGLIEADKTEYLERIVKPEYRKWVADVMNATLTRWKDRSFPFTQESLSKLISESLLHEVTHILIFSLPAGDIPAGREELTKLTFEKYVTLLISEQSLYTSASLFKDIIKALKSVRDAAPSLDTQDDFFRVLSLEMFCDRFGMFLYENHLKNKIYRKVLNADIEKVVAAKMFDEAEAARGSGPEGFASFLKANAKKIFDQSLLEKELSEAEEKNVYISLLGDPGFSEKEREFYHAFLKELQRFNDEETINTFSVEHARTSTPIAISDQGLVGRAHFGLPE